MASSMGTAMGSMGMLTSMTIVIILTFFIENLPISVHTAHDFMVSMHTMFIIFGLLNRLRTGCSLRRIAPGQAKC
ncbi:MAG: hypothetical protein RBT11_11130 [Desulfobacterales bacterium]|jgi:uncharacterized protein YhhL (DUF1145 family)|nr:hypothetical protein [Desulfobacterales bacterium]